jgi:hypothetical protein
VLTAKERAEAASVVPASLAGLTTRQDLVGALGDALAGSGEPINLQMMDAGTRSHTAALFRRLERLQSESRPATASVYRMQYVTNTEVSAKGLY